MNSLIYEDKILSFLGLAAKSNTIVYGKLNIKHYLSSPQIKQKLIIVACDAGKRVKLEIFKKCKYYNVPFIEINKTKSDISKAIGKVNVSVVGITNENIIHGILGVVRDNGGGL
jgi:ribosomal protein L7Ae-like RNA K-turn-binding protein